ncbi:MAG TPA: IclR family transcriptional regulator [Armatimonadota bacterium]|jgi:DNA-binding IclR family transcriptional regulator
MPTELTVERDTDRYHVPNLERALALMEYLATRPEGAGLAEMAAALHYPNNSVFRIAMTLLTHGYLQRDDASKVFRLSCKLLALGYAALGDTHLVEHARAEMRALRDSAGETTLLGILAGTEGIVLEQFASRQPLKFLVDPGAHFPLHTSAPGKALLAALPDAELQALCPRLPLTRYTARTLTSLDALQDELVRTRARGYSTDLAEEVEGLYCVGAPIRNYAAYPVAALWITGPTSRIAEDDLDRLGALVAAHARRVSVQLGYRDAGVDAVNF